MAVDELLDEHEQGERVRQWIRQNAIGVVGGIAVAAVPAFLLQGTPTGLLIGLAEAFVPADYSAYKDAVAFALLFAVLLLRPQGLLGKAQIQKV